MIILEDSRQQAGKHENIRRWFTVHGIEIKRTKLLCGDYTLPTDQSVCIDTKYGLSEVYGDLIGKDHARFVRELDTARECGIELVILVEEGGISSLSEVRDWRNPRRYQYFNTPQRLRPSRPPVPSWQLQKTMETVAERHGCIWRFCSKAETGKRIFDILTRKEAIP